MTAAVAKPSETHLHLAGELLTPLPEGALWWARKRVLVVSDLHFEKGSAFAARGQMLPPYDTAATLSVVERLCPFAIVLRMYSQVGQSPQLARARSLGLGRSFIGTFRQSDAQLFPPLHEASHCRCLKRSRCEQRLPPIDERQKRGFGPLPGPANQIKEDVTTRSLRSGPAELIAPPGEPHLAQQWLAGT